MSSSSHVDWLDLPEHLLPLILKKFSNIKDLIRFGAVCQSWRSIYLQNHHHLSSSHQLPFLLIITMSEDHPYKTGLYENNPSLLQSRTFYDLSTEKLHTFPSPIPHMEHCRGSSHGWLTMNDGSRVYLLNPFSTSRRIIELPPLTTLEFREGDVIAGDIGLSIAVLSTNPLSNNYILMAAIEGGFNRLAFYKSGDNSWSSFDNDVCFVEDIICDEENNLFYAVDCTSSVWVCDFSVADNPALSRLPTPEFDETFADSSYDILSRFIVKSSEGQLFTIGSVYDLDECHPSPIVSFLVFKLDPIELTWVETKDLRGHTLFLDECHASMSSVLTIDHPGCKPNCIYYTQERTERTDLAHIKVYNLEDGSIQSYHRGVDNVEDDFKEAIWIKPTPN